MTVQAGTSGKASNGLSMIAALPGRSVMIWIQARDIHAEHARLAATGVPLILARKRSGL